MTNQELKIRQDMNLAARDDRERFFKVADTLHLQPKYKCKLVEIEAVKQQWRDMTTLPDYPNIDFPLTLPDWFPSVFFASCWHKDVFIQQEVKRHEEMEKLLQT